MTDTTKQPTCGTCAAMDPAVGEGAEDFGFCHANPPTIVTADGRTSFFPPVTLSKTWCLRWRPKTTQ